jgi:hypothetical protein
LKKGDKKMVIVTNVVYPPERAKQVAECFMKAPQIPEYMSRKGPYISSDIVNGISTMSIYELDKSKLAEGMEFLANYMVLFFEVPDFTYEIKPFFEIAEALKMIGMG